MRATRMRSWHFLYLRTGQYQRFATLYQTWAAAFPQSVTVREKRENFEKYRGRPNQVNGRRRQSVVRHDVDGYVTLPISSFAIRGEQIERVKVRASLDETAGS